MRQQTELWILAGLTALLAFAGGSAIQDVTGVTDMTGADKIRQQVAASGLDTSKYDSLVSQMSQLFSVPVEWIKAVIGQESSFRENPPVRIGDASYGLMQLTPTTARALGFSGMIPDGLLVPSTNIYFGTMLLGQLRQAYGDDFLAVYSAYNSGSPTKYKTSAQVATDVNGAVAWLGYFTA